MCPTFQSLSKEEDGKKREEEDETEGVDLFNRLAAKASGRLPLRFFFFFFFFFSAQ